jgi:phosphoribosylglycinamide formyltransferase 1
MLKIVFLCSGGGGNLRFIAEAIRRGLLVDAEICGVITDRECSASFFARQENIPVSECDFSEPDQSGLMDKLIDLGPGVIVSNVHKILSPTVVDSFRGRLVNLHYSLLPAFGGVIGAKALTQALDYGAQLVGTTVHWVDHLVDAGSVIRGDEALALMDIVFRAGCISLLTGMELIRGDKQVGSEELRSLIEVSGRMVLFSPQVVFFSEFHDKCFWESLK